MDWNETKVANERLYAHMMSAAKPETWRNTLGMSDESIRGFQDTPWLKEIRTVYLIGHGTSLATSMNGESAVAHIARVHAQAVPAFSFVHYTKDYVLRPEETLVVGVSCSGDTKSVVDGLKAARDLGAHTLIISGEGDIKAAKYSDLRIVTDAHVESRAGINAYSISHLFILLAIHRLAILLGQQNGALAKDQAAYWQAQQEKAFAAMACLPKLFQDMHALYLDLEKYGAKNYAVLGTGPNRGTAQEGALKICEFCWRFGAADELEDFAHGRFREVGDREPLFMIAPDANTTPKVMDLLAGCQVSKTPSVVFTAAPTPAMKKLATHIIEMPAMDNEYMTPFLYVFPLWFYGYHVRHAEHGLVGEKRHGLYAVDINFSARFTEDGLPK